MRKDALTEHEFGKGAIRAIGKCLMCRRHDFEGNKITLFAGVIVTKDEIVSPLNRKQKKETKDFVMQDDDELWEGEFIFIPRVKYKCNKEQGWKGLEISQKLASAWGTVENWVFKIFDRKENNEH